MKTFLAVFFGILAAALVIVVVAGLFFGARWKHEETTKLRAWDLQEAVAHLRTINIACVTYQSTYERGFPQELSDLAPPAGSEPDPKHAGLIDAVLASGNTGEYTFIYKASRKGQYNQVQGYQVWASPQKRSNQPGRSFYSDQTGVIRFTDENRAASENDAPTAD
jgi:hypothetical protein